MCRRSHLNGDFLSPCSLTAVDGGRGMTEGLNLAKLDYVCLGNHEFDFGFDVIATRVKQFKGKCINSNVPDERIDKKLLPKYDIIEVGDRKVLVAGLLTGDTSIYAPSNTPIVTPPAEAAVALWNEAKAELGYTPDLFLPMTHQLIHEDKATAVALSKHDELAKCTPFLLAGHEHDMYVDEAGRSTIVKVGSDAERIGVCDVWWNAQGKVQSRCVVLPLVRIRSRASVPKVCQVAARLPAVDDVGSHCHREGADVVEEGAARAKRRRVLPARIRAKSAA